MASTNRKSKLPKAVVPKLKKEMAKKTPKRESKETPPRILLSKIYMSILPSGSRYMLSIAVSDINTEKATEMNDKTSLWQSGAFCNKLLSDVIGITVSSRKHGAVGPHRWEQNFSGALRHTVGEYENKFYAFNEGGFLFRISIDGALPYGTGMTLVSQGTGATLSGNRVNHISWSRSILNLTLAVVKSNVEAQLKAIPGGYIRVELLEEEPNTHSLYICKK